MASSLDPALEDYPTHQYRFQSSERLYIGDITGFRILLDNDRRIIRERRSLGNWALEGEEMFSTHKVSLIPIYPAHKTAPQSFMPAGGDGEDV